MSSLHHWAVTAVTTLLLHSGAVTAAPDTASPLSLDAAETLALARHPELRERAALIAAARANARASGELPDPQVALGVQNVPVDSFAFNRDGMTMSTVGIAQSFPPLGQRALLKQSAEAETGVAEAERADARARIRRDVRLAWLDLFYLDRALEVTRENAAFVTQMVAAETARYQVGAAEQTAVLGSGLERDELLDQQEDLAAQRAKAVSDLARLLDVDATQLHIAAQLPPPAPPPNMQALIQGLARHPEIQALEDAHSAAAYQTAAARRAYYPEFNVQASYGYRAASDSGGAKLPDMVSAQVTMSLPLFPDKRQDARLQERVAREQAALYRRDDMLLALRATAEARLADQQRLHARLQLLENSRLPKADQAVQAGLAAYTAHRLSLADLLGLLHQRHQYSLTEWRLKVDLARNAADLDYLADTAGESSDASN